MDRTNGPRPATPRPTTRSHDGPKCRRNRTVPRRQKPSAPVAGRSIAWDASTFASNVPGRIDPNQSQAQRSPSAITAAAASPVFQGMRPVSNRRRSRRITTPTPASGRIQTARPARTPAAQGCESARLAAASRARSVSGAAAPWLTHRKDDRITRLPPRSVSTRRPKAEPSRSNRTQMAASTAPKRELASHSTGRRVTAWSSARINPSPGSERPKTRSPALKTKPWPRARFSAYR
jgi:hypothetical protein